MKIYKNLTKLSIILITVTGFGQSTVISENEDYITVELIDGERVTFKKILKVDTTKFDKEHFQNEVNGKKLTSIVIGRKKGLGMKTKSKYDLDYDQQLMIHNNGEEVYFLTPSMIYKRPTLTRDKKDVIEKSKKSQLAIK